MDLTVDKPVAVYLRYAMRDAYDRPDIHNCQLPGDHSELNGYQTCTSD